MCVRASRAASTRSNAGPDDSETTPLRTAAEAAAAAATEAAEADGVCSDDEEESGGLVDVAAAPVSLLAWCTAPVLKGAGAVAWPDKGRRVPGLPERAVRSAESGRSETEWAALVRSAWGEWGLAWSTDEDDEDDDVEEEEEEDMLPVWV